MNYSVDLLKCKNAVDFDTIQNLSFEELAYDRSRIMEIKAILKHAEDEIKNRMMDIIWADGVKSKEFEGVKYWIGGKKTNVFEHDTLKSMMIEKPELITALPKSPAWSVRRLREVLTQQEYADLVHETYEEKLELQEVPLKILEAKNDAR